MNKCFLTNKSDCELVEILIDGKIYKIDENLTENLTLKEIKVKITEKESNIEEKKKNIISNLKSAIEDLGLSKEDLAEILLGRKIKEETIKEETIKEETIKEETTKEETTKEETSQRKTKKLNDEGFKEVSGELTSSIRATVNIESGSPISTMPAYNKIVHDGKKIVEEGKKIKHIDGAIISRGNMGTTVISVIDTDSSKIDKELREVDANGDLVRKVFGKNKHPVPCSLCDSTGFTKIGNNLCPKCKGSGFITI